LVRSTLVRLNPNRLKQHEEIDKARLRRVVRAMRSGGLRKALAADERTLVLLDGTHRLEAMRRLGARSVPVLLLDYMSDDIVVNPGAGKTAYSKQAVLDAGLSRKKLPPKSTRHMVRRDDGTLVHISKIEPVVNLTLAQMGARVRGPRPPAKDRRGRAGEHPTRIP
jgi:L-serine kinase (ADP)